MKRDGVSSVSAEKNVYGDARKEINDIEKEIRTKAIPPNCVLCNRPGKKANSHSVPDMILQSIAQKGWILKTDAVTLSDSRTHRGEGIRRAGAFHSICADCDRKYFKHYEDPNRLRNKPDGLMMAEIALKNSLYQLSLTCEEIELFRYFHSEKPDNIYIISRLNVLKRDKETFLENVRFYQRIVEIGESDSFVILYHKLLPYSTQIAAQGQIPLWKDMQGKVINDNFQYFEKTQSMHIAVFPLKDITFILAFYHDRDNKYDELKNQMMVGSEKRILEYLNYVIIEHTDNCFFSKRILDIIQNDSKLRLLARENNGIPDFGNNVQSWEELDIARKQYVPIKADEITNLLEYQI